MRTTYWQFRFAFGGRQRLLQAAALVSGVVLLAAPALAETEYFVKPAALGGDDGAVGTSWTTALASPQAAVAKAVSGDTITITNGTYVINRGATGGTSLFLALTINQGILMRSVNGPAVTIIDANGGNSRRTQLIKITHAGAQVEGLTFWRGWVWDAIAGVEMSAGTLRDCVIRDCHANYGMVVALTLSGNALAERCIVTGSTSIRNPAAVSLAGTALLRNSLIYGNTVLNHGLAQLSYAGGDASVVSQSGGTMQHVTIAGNRAGNGTVTGLKLTGGTVANSIIYHNRHPGLPTSDMFSDLNVFQTGGTITDSILSPLIPGAGNVNADPLFVNLAAGDFRLTPGSPAMDAGTDLGLADDLARNARPVDGNGDAGSVPDMGCYEAPAAASGELRCGIEITPPVAVGAGTVQFRARLAGANTSITAYVWDFGNGQTTSGVAVASSAYGVGVYTVTLRATNSASQGAVMARTNAVYRAPATVYVSKSGTPAFPFDTPAKAASALQPAIDAAAVTATRTSVVVVADGIYQQPLYTPVNLYKGITVRSANGWRGAILTRGTDVTRLVELNHADAVFAGFTITNGYGGTAASSARAGGVWMESGTLEDCWVVKNEAGHGAGIRMNGGLVNRCRITDNLVTANLGYGAVEMYRGTVRNSLVARNRATAGTSANNPRAAGIGMNPTVAYPYVPAYSTHLENVTVVDNTSASQYAYGAGVFRWATTDTITNSIIWFNTREYDAAALDLVQRDHVSMQGIYTHIGHTACPNLPDDPGGTGNRSAIANPGFAARGAGNYRLSAASPCVNVGKAQVWMTDALDLDGNPRRQGTPEMGAYENPPRGTLFIMR